jgi:hypothetical protein
MKAIVILAGGVVVVVAGIQLSGYLDNERRAHEFEKECRAKPGASYLETSGHCIFKDDYGVLRDEKPIRR